MRTLTACEVRMKTFDDGREEQFEAMMKQLAAMAAKYKGVRGELLEKVKDELLKTKPGRSTGAGAAPMSTAPMRAAVQKMLPSCRLCGRGMKLADDGSLVCEKGHVRAAA
jgi:hypothetical protein